MHRLIHLLVKKKRGKAGFTLLELLITLVITSIIAISGFSILISSMHTFHKEGEISKAIDTKNMLIAYIREFIKNRETITLAQDNVDAVIHANEVKLTKGVLDKDNKHIPTKAYDVVVDPKMKLGHMLYSDGRRIYTVSANSDSQYFTSKQNIHLTTSDGGYITVEKNMPYVQDINDPNCDVKEAKQDYYAQPLIDEQIYHGYDVSLTFRMLYSRKYGDYYNLQIIIDIIDPAKNNIVVTRSIETITMLNLVYKAKPITFLPKPLLDDKGNPLPIDPAGYEKDYMFCYFS